MIKPHHLPYSHEHPDCLIEICPRYSTSSHHYSGIFYILLFRYVPHNFTGTGLTTKKHIHLSSYVLVTLLIETNIQYDTIFSCSHNP